MSSSETSKHKLISFLAVQGPKASGIGILEIPLSLYLFHFISVFSFCTCQMPKI